MESADSLATLQYEVAKKNLTNFCKSKDFENLSVKEKKEVLIERINSSYIIKNLYNLFALSYERLLQKDDSAFSDLDTLLSVFAEEFKKVQVENFEEFFKNASDKQKFESSKLINLKEGTKIKFEDGSVAKIFYSSHDGYELQFEYHNGFTNRSLSCLINTFWEIVDQEEDSRTKNT